MDVLEEDELLVHDSKLEDIDDKLLQQYYGKEYGENMMEQGIPISQIIENLCLAKNGSLTLAGLLLFGRQPQLHRPTLMVKAISFFGDDVSETLYRDSEDIKGNIPEIFKNSMAFLLRNLHKLQNNQSVNSVGELEIPRIVLEELLVNALVHRDYFIDAPVNIFIFDNRIELISPGKLPNTISIENIKHGISVIRNPIIASFAAKLLPYRGIGSGIVRALKNYDKIDFDNDRQAERFKATIWRKVQ